MKLENLTDGTDIVLFDFDDTLCIHSLHGNYDYTDDEYIEAMINGDVDWWDRIGCLSNRHMKEFMDRCSKLGIRMGLISAVEMSCTAENKIEWVLRKYGYKLDNYCTSDTDMKAKLVKIVANSSGVHNVLFIDDLYSNLEKVADNLCSNVEVATPMEVVNYIENLTE